MASVLLEELRAVVAEVRRSQIEDVVVSLWGALVAEEDTQEKGRGTLLFKPGAEEEGGRERRR